MGRALLIAARVGLWLLPLCALYFAYWSAFSAWSTALPNADVHAWQRFFCRMIFGLVAAVVIWSACLVTVLRRRRLRRLGAIA
jgi:hypothetical protein